ncbi:gustatory receptor for sugar taste 64a-like [Epargyreus clarus]|uniref:gustatory receptor for sugar taste 64a-like n=1 Tax=Epargyreus clarus TaxID=520877 RepID=UPI003C2CDCC0
MSNVKAEFLNEVTPTKHHDDLILPNQPNHDEFLKLMHVIYHYSRLFGIAGSGSYYWKIWGVIILCLLVTIDILAAWKVFKALAGWAVNIIGHRSVTARLAGAMFYGTAILSLIQCWRLSSSWRAISAYWALVERMLFTKYVPSDPTLRKRLILVIVLITVCATFEHIVSMISVIEFDWTASLMLRRYILRSHGFILLPSDYSIPVAVVLLFISNIATILWNLQDLYIVLISMGLTSRYHRLNQCVAKVCARDERESTWNKELEPLTVYTWRKIREAYVKQAMLVRKVDDSLGGLILLSNFCNFYFICLQLFLGISQGAANTPQKQLYYLISLAWLCIRASSVVLSAANVNSYSRRALPYLYDCRAQYYNIEIERLQDQLTKEYVALSGMGFFSLTRTVLLQMAGAVVTYELVLIQFDSSDRNSTQV